jgi:hypothetical protein
VLHVIQQGADLVHDPLALQTAGLQFLPPGAAIEGPAFDVENLEALLDQVLEMTQPLLLQRIVAGQRAHPLELAGPVTRGAIVGFQKILLARDQIAAHSGLTIERNGAQVLEGDAHVVGMFQLGGGARQVRQRVDGPGQQNDQGQPHDG